MFERFMIDGLAPAKRLLGWFKKSAITPYFFTIQCRRLLALVAVLTLTACGGGGGDGDGINDRVMIPEVGASEATMMIDGSATKGVLRNARVDLYPLRGSTLLASGRTDNLGGFNLVLYENDLRQLAGDNPLGAVLRVQVSGDSATTMICDTDCGDVAMGEPVAATDLMLEGTVFVSFSDTRITKHLNVFTTLISATIEELELAENITKLSFSQTQKSASDLIKSELELLVDAGVNLAVAEVPAANELDPVKHDKDTQLLSIVNASFADVSHAAWPGATIEIIRIALQELIKDEINGVDVDPAVFDAFMVPVKIAATNVVALVEATIGNALDTDLANDLAADISDDLQKSTLSDFVSGLAPITGLNSFFMGHSFFRPVADMLQVQTEIAGLTDHSQQVYFAGGQSGTPDNLWLDPTNRANVQAILDGGGIEQFGMVIAYDQLIDSYVKWIDYALQSNPLRRVFIAFPWATFPEDNLYPYDQFQDGHRNGLHPQIDALRSLYPDLEIFCLPYGLTGYVLEDLFYSGDLPEISQYTGPTATSIRTDAKGHGGTMLKQFSVLMWLGSLYHVHLNEHDFETGYPNANLKQLATELIDEHDIEYRAP